MTRPSLPSRLARSDRGASLVEFAVVLPMMILLFAVIVEGGRMMWSYQSVAEGVREAARYLSRIAPANVCTTSGLAAHTGDLYDMVEKSYSDVDLFPDSRRVIVNSVTAECVDGAGWPGVDPVVQVTATVTIQLPLGNLFAIMGGSGMGPITTAVSDRARVFGT